MDNRKRGSLAQIKDTAAQWIARRGAEGWSEADEAELTRWLEASSDHRIAYLRLEAMWSEANRLKVLGAGLEPGKIPTLEDFAASPFFKHAQRSPSTEAEEICALLEPTERKATQRRSRPGGSRLPSRRLVWTMAAGVLLALGVLLFQRIYLRGDLYSTPVGVTANVPLPDGTKVTLNTDSQIRVMVTSDLRRVSLEHGEAFFDVARDMKRPFIVSAGEQRITVLGTRFSVRRDGDDVQVVVTEGKVRVDPRRGEEQHGLQVKAGEVAHSRDERVAVQERSVPRAEELLSWRSGYLVFHETSLQEAAAEFNRYNDQQIVVDDPRVARITISGNFRATNIGSFTHLLESGFPVSVERDGDRLVLRAR